MSNTADAILLRIERCGYRIGIISTSRGLIVEAIHSTSGARFAVHASPNGSFAAARELADMTGVSYADLLPSHRVQRFLLDDPELDEAKHRLARVSVET